MHECDALAYTDPDKGLLLAISPWHPLTQHRPFEMSVVHASNWDSAMYCLQDERICSLLMKKI